MNADGGSGDELLVTVRALVLAFSDVRLNVPVQILLPHEFLVAHLARWHRFLKEN